MFGFAAVLAGALLHLAIDVLACPGIPLLAPVADRKYTMGILPGPSILLACAALGLVLVTVTRLLEFSQALLSMHGLSLSTLQSAGYFSCMPVYGFKDERCRK